MKPGARTHVTATDIDLATRCLISTLIHAATWRPVLSKHAPDPVLEILQACTTKQVREIAAVMWLGRGDFDSLAHALKVAKRDTADYLATYITEKRPLAEYLARGLERMNAEENHD